MNSQAIAVDQTRWLAGMGIRRIRVENLFGQRQYTYDLKHSDLLPSQAPKLILLYGDNGSGKTTILKLLFHLLSPVDKKGHKTAVSRIRFKKFGVEFADGTSVIALRSDPSLIPYKMIVNRGNQLVAEREYGGGSDADEFLLESTAKELIKLRKRIEDQEAAHEKILSHLKTVNPGEIYVTDSRRVYSTISSFMAPDDEPDTSTVTVRGSRKSISEEASRSGLSLAVAEISAWATQQALQGSAQGEEDVNSAYAVVTKRLAHAPELFQQPVSVDDVISLLHEQGERSSELVRFGLMKPLKVDDIVQSLRQAPLATRDSIVAVLLPYITGVKARIDALEPICHQFASFVNTMNSFYRNKRVDLHASSGVRITVPTGEQLAPSHLSSGESQLLYLFASALVAKDRATLFMIDEPELSLNVKWQRQILDSLLSITAGSNVQFIFATHSIELLTRFSEFVLDLNTVQEPLFA